MRCSGNADQFWESETKKYKIAPSFCKALIPECAPTLANTTMIVQFFKAARIMQNAAQGVLGDDYVRGGPVPPYMPFPTASLNPLIDGVELLDMDTLTNLIECGNDPETCANSNGLMLNFCEQFSFHWINHAIEGHELVIKDGVSKLNQFEEMRKNMDLSQSPMELNPRRRRILPNSPPRKLQTCDLCSRDEGHPMITKTKPTEEGYEIGIEPLVPLGDQPLSSKILTSISLILLIYTSLIY